MATVDTSFLDAWNPAASGGGGSTVNGFFDVLDNGLGAWVELEKVKAKAERTADAQDDTRNTINGRPIVDTSYLPQFTSGMNNGNTQTLIVLGAVGLGVYLLMK